MDEDAGLYEALEQRLNFEFELFELEEMTHLPTLPYMVDSLRWNTVLYRIYSLLGKKHFVREFCTQRSTRR